MQKFNPNMIKKGLLPTSTHLLRLNQDRNYSTDVDYQFMQRSKIPMLHFQPSLPRLPIPLLEKTCERYLAAQRPLLDDSSFEQTKKITESFRQGVGMELHKILKDKDTQNKHTSYISEPWFNMYLADRAPLPINYNPLLMMKHDERPEYNSQLLRASNLIVSSLRFMRSLKAELLEPEVYHMNAKKSDTDRFRNIARLSPSLVSTYVAYAFKAFPLDMSQYHGLFAATRIPEQGKDRIYRKPEARHLIVLRNGNFYSMDVLENDGNILEPHAIMERLSVIMHSNEPPAEFPIGVLTTENRDKWAELRKNLVKGNEENVKLIDSAIFCLCLDNTSFDEANNAPMIRDFLFSDGTNRWFDKSVSMMVAADGTAGLNFEHSWGDGVAVLRFFQEIYKETTTRPFLHPKDLKALSHVDGTEGVRHLKFRLDDHLKAGIVQAQQNHLSICESLDMNIMKLNTINRNICKRSKISPDSVMQLGFQAI
jgi:carnitine O-palmitoyltransferase 2